MGLVLLWIVGILAMVAFPVSIGWLFLTLGKLSLPRRHFVEHRTALLTPLYLACDHTLPVCA